MVPLTGNVVDGMTDSGWPAIPTEPVTARTERSCVKIDCKVESLANPTLSEIIPTAPETGNVPDGLTEIGCPSIETEPVMATQLLSRVKILCRVESLANPTLSATTDMGRFIEAPCMSTGTIIEEFPMPTQPVTIT
jgi:hypothetical protein